MAVDIHRLIAAINPDVFCQPYVEREGKRLNLIKEVKQRAREQGYLPAAEVARARESEFMDFEEAANQNLFSLHALKNPIEKHVLVYDNFADNPAATYFWILDKLQNEFPNIRQIDKVVDNFSSAPGSRHFTDTINQATQVHREAMRVLGEAERLVRSVVKGIEGLRGLKDRLLGYAQCRSGSGPEHDAALMSFKEQWLDTVDSKRGASAVRVLAQEESVLLEAFMAVQSPLDISRVCRDIGASEEMRGILDQRAAEFFAWLEESERNLRHRFESEREHLKRQVNLARMYARWAKPYLRASQQLGQQAIADASLVSVFNTILLEVTLLGQADYDLRDDVDSGMLPKAVLRMKQRRYLPLLLVELRFRALPERPRQGGYLFRGRLEIIFTSYALNEDELKALKEAIEKDDLGDVFRALSGTTDKELNQLQAELAEFLGDEKHLSRPGTKAADESQDINPFSALFSIFRREQTSSSGGNSIEPDSDIEKAIRNQALLRARRECRSFYELFKQAHNMPTLSGAGALS